MEGWFPFWARFFLIGCQGGERWLRPEQFFGGSMHTWFRFEVVLNVGSDQVSRFSSWFVAGWSVDWSLWIRPSFRGFCNKMLMVVCEERAGFFMKIREESWRCGFVVLISFMLWRYYLFLIWNPRLSLFFSVSLVLSVFIFFPPCFAPPFHLLFHGLCRENLS